MQAGFPLDAALVDYLPTLFFLGGMSFLFKMVAYNIRWMVALGSILVALGSLARATWKVALGLYWSSFPGWLGEIQFHFGAIGFLFLTISTISLFRVANNLPSMIIFSIPGRIPALIFTALLSIFMEGSLAYYAFRRGARLGAFFLAFAVVGLLGMGAFSGREPSVERERYAQTVNLFGQASLLLGMYFLEKHVSTRRAR